MTLEEAIEAKKAAEQKILAILGEFQGATGIDVAGVVFERVETTSFGGQRSSLVTYVYLDCRL